MVQGAAAAGIRAMTSSSSPGISLKTEGISYMAGADVPCVIVNIQRGGPGLGGIQPSQADYWQATKATGHGDFQIFVFAPSSVQEMVDLIGIAFDKADQYRMPAMILGDGMLGQTMEPVVIPEGGKELPEKPWALSGHQGKREHNVVNSLYLSPAELERLIRERFARYEVVKQNEVRYEEFLTDDADYIIVAYGATSRIAKSAAKAAREQGIKAGVLRPITLWPFPEKAIAAAAEKAQAILTVEMSMGQMVDDVRLAVGGRCPVHFFGRTGGIIPTPNEIINELKKLAGGAK